MKKRIFILCAAAFCMSHLTSHAAKQPSAFEKADYVVLLDSTSVSVKPTGSGSFAINKVIKIQSEKGAVDNRIIRYDYDPLTAHATFEHVTITHADGTKKHLDVKKTYDYAAPARAIYWGARQIMIELGALKVGDIIDYQINKQGFTYALLDNMQLLADDEERFVPPMRGHFYDIVPFWVSQPTVRKVYHLNIPAEKDIQYQFYQGACAVSMRYSDYGKTYTWSIDNLLPIQREPNMVDFYDAAPKLMLSSTNHWKDKSLWFNKVNEDYGSFDAIPEAEQKVAEIIKGKTTEMEKVAALTHWVADNIRYSGITMGKGEGYTLHNLKMNFTDRCGVCKDIAGTLIAFLRIAGFQAYPAMTMAGSRVESIPADHFNHCVAVVRLSNGTLMPLDPTWVPFCRELWSSAEQQQNYLPGVPEGSDLLLTPLSAPENHYVRIQVQNILDEQGNLTGVLTIGGEGQSDRAIRNIFTLGMQYDWKNSLENQLMAVSPNAKLLSVDYGKNPKDYQAAPISITFKYSIPNYAMRGNNGELFYKPFSFNNLYNSLKSYMNIDTTVEKRKYGFRDSCSRLIDINETVTLPNGYVMTNPEKNDQMTGSGADFKGSLTQTKNKITLTNNLRLKKRIYQSADWDSFRQAVNAHKNYSNHLIIKKN